MLKALQFRIKTLRRFGFEDFCEWPKNWGRFRVFSINHRSLGPQHKGQFFVSLFKKSRGKSACLETLICLLAFVIRKVWPKTTKLIISDKVLRKFLGGILWACLYCLTRSFVSKLLVIGFKINIIIAVSLTDWTFSWFFLEKKNLAKIRIFRAIDWLSSISSWQVNAKKCR